MDLIDIFLFHSLVIYPDLVKTLDGFISFIRNGCYSLFHDVPGAVSFGMRFVN